MSDGFLQRDLIDHADFDGTPWDFRVGEPFDVDSYTSVPTSRAEAVEAALPDDATVVFERSGGYQGYYALVVWLDDHVWVETGAYGSCGGCDSFLSHRREETARILRSAYCFEDEAAVREWAAASDALEMTYGQSHALVEEALGGPA